ncbi:MAG: hypothetical protein V3T58_03230 [Candidatus Hydrothermarchaeales archaeon]
MTLNQVVHRYMGRVPEVRTYCSRCIATERWDGSVVLMVVDAAFTSIGLNYFLAVVPKVMEFEEHYVKTNRIKTLEELASANVEELRKVWKNRRSWQVAKELASYLATLKKEKSISERATLRLWAKNAASENWHRDPIGRINGVGINTFQYLRMMGGVDTVMPDKIVKRVINQILIEAGKEPVEEDLAFIKTVHKIATNTGYKAIELCWMTWLVQSEGDKIRIEKYAKVLPKI